MPVPVSVTGWHSKPGSQSALDHESMASAGKFSRVERDVVEPPAAPVAAPTEGKVAAPLCDEWVEVVPAATDADVGAPVCVRKLNFTYPALDGTPLEGEEPLIRDMDLVLKKGERCLLLGGNGAGKSTLLRILGGKHMVPESAVTVLGRPVFHDTQLTCSGELAYIGGNWQRDVAFAGYAVPLQGDFPASKMLNSVPGVDPARRQRLIDVLDVDPEWRMHQVSDGQRRRVQLAYGLLKEFQVLLLDEITVDLDVLGRKDLLDFLKDECETRGATVIYVTHIFDGLEDWATRVTYVSEGKLVVNKPASAFPELRADGSGMLELVERWLRVDLKEKQEREKRQGNPMKKRVEWHRNNGWAAGRTASSLAKGGEISQITNASNAVLRC